jgi:hypothetical protein
MRKIKYYYNNKIYEFGCTNNKIQPAFYISLKRKLGISINDYLTYNNIDNEKCRICKVGNPPLDINFEIVNNFIKIKDFSFKKKVYCYGENCECEGIKMNSNSFEFLSKINNISIDDAKILLKENNKSPFYKENHKSDDLYKKSQSRSIEYYINKYGIELGNDKYKEHIGKISIANSEEGYIDKYGRELGIKMFNDISYKKDSMSFYSFIKKNSGNYEKAIFEYEERKKSVNVSIENFINKYGYDIAIQKHKNRVEKQQTTINNNPNREEIFKSRGITIDNLFKKYGDIKIATEKYNDWRISVSVPFCLASKESLKVFNPIIETIMNEYDIKYDDIFIGSSERNEYFLRNEKDIYFYDFTIKSKKIIIEYNGVLFHPKSEKSDWVNPMYRELSSEDAYNKQKRKLQTAIDSGFSVFEIWSDDVDKYDKCLNFIKNNIK